MYSLPDCSNIPNKCNTQGNEFCAMIIHCWSHLSDIILTLFIDQNNWTVFPRRLSILLHWCSWSKTFFWGLFQTKDYGHCVSNLFINVTDNRRYGDLYLPFYSEILSSLFWPHYDIERFYLDVVSFVSNSRSDNHIDDWYDILHSSALLSWLLKVDITLI